MTSEMRGALLPGTRKAYVLSNTGVLGPAIFTILSPKTGTRFTYKVRRSEETPGRPPVFFVKVLTGSDNESSYTYAGIIKADGRFTLTGKSKLSATAPSVVAFDWLARNWESDRVEVWHEGICGRCGKKLTVPESVARGLGPDCAAAVDGLTQPNLSRDFVGVL